MINLEDVRFRYSEGHFELQVDSLSIAEARRSCWYGPSGSGKTTLLHLVAGIHAPDVGLVRTCGVDVGVLGESTRRDFRIANIGLVFQDFALLDYLSLLDNILLPYRISWTMNLDPAVRNRAQELAVSVGLGEMLRRRPTKLSQGERQRIAVCRAIIANPKLVLADEPTANLDPENAALVLDLLDNYVAASGATLIVVSHDRSVLDRFDETIDVASFCTRTQETGSLHRA